MRSSSRTFVMLSLAATLTLSGCNNQKAATATAASADAAKQDAAAKQAAMEQQQIETTEAEKQHAAAFQKHVEQNKKKSKAMNKGSKVWTNYLP